MNSEDIKRLQELAKQIQKENRSKKEIKATFQAAGIIDKDGKLKSPYKNIFIPS